MAFSLTANDRPRTLLLIDQEPSNAKAIREALDPLDTEFELAAVRTLSGRAARGARTLVSGSAGLTRAACTAQSLRVVHFGTGVL
jgi:hypothetical protein